ncbi:unnamed protein product [Rhodiola kirilowii]
MIPPIKSIESDFDIRLNISNRNGKPSYLQFSNWFADSIMDSPPGSTAGFQQNPRARRPLGFLANAKKHKQSFFQFFFMTGVMLLSVRSLGQKYRLNNLQEDAAALRDERDQLVDRMDNIKSGLLHEASLDSSGVFGKRLRELFGDAE